MNYNDRYNDLAERLDQLNENDSQTIRKVLGALNESGKVFSDAALQALDASTKQFEEMFSDVDARIANLEDLQSRVQSVQEALLTTASTFSNPNGNEKFNTYGRGNVSHNIQSDAGEGATDTKGK
jgi:hypothetical protein